MKAKIFLLSILAIIFSGSVLAADNPPQNSNSLMSATTNTSSTTSTTTNAPSPTQSDAQILKIIMVVNTNEVNAGKLAEGKATNSDVKNFAKKMQADHSKNLKDAEKLANKLNIKPEDSDTSNDLQKQGQEEGDKLAATDPTKFDQDYMDAMVNGHKKVLDMLDNTIPNTKNPDLVKFLKATRNKVEQHYKLAQEVSKKIAKQ